MIDQERTQSLFRKLEQLLARKQARPSVERVHQIRTTARRLEAVLEIVYPEPTTRVAKLRKGLKRLRQRAGAVRDVDVQLAALRTLKIGREVERKTRLMAALADRRADRESELVRILTAKSIDKLRKRMSQTGAEMAMASQPPEQNGHNWPPTWIDFNPASASLRMFARLVRQTPGLVADNLHAYRIGCKRIRYVAEMAGNVPEAKHLVTLLKRIQDAIGDWHDWLTLTQAAEQLFARSMDSALVSALQNVTNAKFTHARSVVSENKRELMREYRSMLANVREQRKMAAPPPKKASSHPTIAKHASGAA